MTEQGSHAQPSNVAVWVWLVVLLAVGLGVAYLPLNTDALIILVLGVAIIKATLVARYYMHLISEDVLVYAIAGVPLVLAIGFVLSLIPDVILAR